MRECISRIPQGQDVETDTHFQAQCRFSDEERRKEGKVLSASWESGTDTATSYAVTGEGAAALFTRYVDGTTAKTAIRDGFPPTREAEVGAEAEGGAARISAVGEAGFEPATTSTQSLCTTGLCDSPWRAPFVARHAAVGYGLALRAEPLP